MGARFGAELDLPGAPAEVLGAVDERSTTAIEQILYKKISGILKIPVWRVFQTSREVGEVHAARGLFESHDHLRG